MSNTITDISKTGLNLKLKAIKYCEFASEETNCYTANLYVDEKVFAIVSNDGIGGCDNTYKHPKCKLLRVEHSNKISEINEKLGTIRTAPSKFIPKGLKFDLELWCGEQVTKFLIDKEFKNLLKTKTIIIDGGKCYTIARKWDNNEKFINKLEKQYKGCLILNTLSFEEGVEKYIKYAT